MPAQHKPENKIRRKAKKGQETEWTVKSKSTNLAGCISWLTESSCYEKELWVEQLKLTPQTNHDAFLG